LYHSALGWRVIKKKKTRNLQKETKFWRYLPPLQGYLAHKKTPAEGDEILEVDMPAVLPVGETVD